MLDDAIEKLTKMLIVQDLKDKENGIEYIRIPKKQILKENIKLIKLIKKFK